MANTDRFIEVRDKTGPAKEQPPACPKCGSKHTSSAAKRPTENSYWRCLKCGDVWNPALLSRPAGRW